MIIFHFNAEKLKFLINVYIDIYVHIYEFINRNKLVSSNIYRNRQTKTG